MHNQMMMTTKALASHHGRSVLPLPSKRDPKISTQKGKQIFSNNTIPTKNIQMTAIQSLPSPSPSITEYHPASDNYSITYQDGNSEVMSHSNILKYIRSPTTIIPASKCISHEKSMDIQIQNKRTWKPKISQPSVEIRSQRLLSSTRCVLLRELRSSCLLHNVTFTLLTHKHSRLSSTTIRRICCLHSNQTRLKPSTSLLWMCRRTRRSTQIRLSSLSPSVRHEKQSSRMGSTIRKRLHRLRTNTPQKRRMRLGKIRQQFKDSNPKCATKSGKYYRGHCSRTRKR